MRSVSTTDPPSRANAGPQRSRTSRSRLRGHPLSVPRGEGTGSVASEPVADESVQADALLCGGESQLTVKGLGNANVELA
jgi:hypothetical protein